MSMRDQIAKAIAGRIKAWHASPHDFDRVDMSRIGTGQGAATYGPGFYAAENPKVSGVGGEYWKEFMRHPAIEDKPRRAYEKMALEYLTDAEGDRSKAARWLEETIKNHPEANQRFTREAALGLLQSDKQVGPRVYELNIKADPQSFLQWDKPLTQQDPAVRGVVEKYQLGRDTGRTSIVHDESTGENIYRVLGHRLAGVEPGSAAASIGLGQRDAMDALKDAGIPGVRYLDANSRLFGPVNDPLKLSQLADVTARLEKFRAKGENLLASELEQTKSRLEREIAQPRTHNYVINNPDIIEIAKKYGIPGAIAAPAIGSVAAQDQYQ